MTPRDKKALFSGLCFTAPWFVGLGVFVLYPVLASVYYSFCDCSVLTPAVFSGLENYRRLLHDDLFWISLKNTLVFAIVSVPLGTAVSLSLAVLLNCEVRGTAFFRTVFYLPSVVPIMASSMLW